MACYLLHFVDRKTKKTARYKHAGHYLGFSMCLDLRLNAHRQGDGARLVQVVTEAGLDFVLARVWPDGDRALEHQLKSFHSGVKLCPVCAQEKLARQLGLDLTASEIEVLFREW